MISRSELPNFSRSSIGRNRWFWVVTEDWVSDPIAHGIARTPEEAQKEAELRCGPVSQTSATHAKGFWRRQRAEARQQAVANSDDAQPLEFAYLCYWDYSDYDSSEYEVIEPHRIVKITKKRLYVEDDEYDSRPSSGEWWDYDRSTFVLDRLEFETTGKANRTGRWRWHSTYYADPALFHIERGKLARPACFEELNLSADATVAQIKAAYRRLSRATHPDAGGTNDDFVKLVQSYEEALKVASMRRSCKATMNYEKQGCES
jgi:DnaJ domain